MGLLIIAARRHSAVATAADICEMASNYFSCYHRGVGRGRGVGRDRGVALGVAVAVGVGVGVTVAVGVAVGVTVGLTVGVTVAVGVGVIGGVGVGVIEGVGHGVPIPSHQVISTVSTRQPSLEPLLSLAIRQRSLPGFRIPGKFTSVVMNPSELPLHACRPAIGLPRSVLIVRL
jgi:hypothetical protein